MMPNKKECASMPRRGYRNLTIPEGVYKKLEKYVENHGCYVSFLEVVREALSEYLKSRRRL